MNVWFDILYGASCFSGGAVVSWVIKPNWLRSSVDHREAVRQDMATVVNVEAIEQSQHLRKIELMKRRTRGLPNKFNPNQPARIFRMKRRGNRLRWPVEPPEKKHPTKSALFIDESEGGM